MFIIILYEKLLPFKFLFNSETVFSSSVHERKIKWNIKSKIILFLFLINE